MKALPFAGQIVFDGHEKYISDKRKKASGRRAMTNIEIYSQPTCPACNELKEYLKNKGIRFEDHDIISDYKALEEMLHVHKVRVTPLIVIGGKKLVGFDVEELEKALAENK
jgi:glutaredoxin-like YruB-family protein